MEICMIETGVANTASVAAAFGRLGVKVRLTSDPEVVADATAVVLPGVGAFAVGMDVLNKTGLGARVRERIDRGEPTLAICLGLQLLCRSSDEAPGLAGLGALPLAVRQLSGAPRLPHIGWSSVAWEDSDAEGGSSRSGDCLLYTSPSPRDKRQSRMPSSA